MPDMNHLYIIRLPHDSKYDEMLRDQGCLDYIFYLKKRLIKTIVIDLRDLSRIRAVNTIPKGASVVIAVIRASQIRHGLTVARYLKWHKSAVIIFGKLINYGAFATPYLNCSQYRFIDYVIPSKYGETAVLRYLQGDPSFLVNNAASQKVPESNASEISLGDLKTSDMPHRNPFLTYEVSRGCPNRCYYCANSLSVFQYKKVAQVISEIKKLSRINKTRKLVFVGPEINFNNIYLAELMAKLVPLNIQWTSYAVPRCLSKELLSGMKEAGCRLLSLGLESADQNTLDAIGKRTNVEEVSRIMHDCHDLGIKTQVHIIVGFPHEKSEDIRKIQKFILINRKVITNINISNLDIPKDSRILSDLDCKGIVLDGLDEGDYFSFYEKGRSSVEKRAEISARVKKLYHFIGKLQLSVFTEGTSFDESFGGLYLQSLGLDSDGHLHEPLKRRK